MGMATSAINAPRDEVRDTQSHDLGNERFRKTEHNSSMSSGQSDDRFNELSAHSP